MSYLLIVNLIIIPCICLKCGSDVHAFLSQFSFSIMNQMSKLVHGLYKDFCLTFLCNFIAYNLWFLLGDSFFSCTQSHPVLLRANVNILTRLFHNVINRLFFLLIDATSFIFWESCRYWHIITYNFFFFLWRVWQMHFLMLALKWEF